MKKQKIMNVNISYICQKRTPPSQKKEPKSSVYFQNFLTNKSLCCNMKGHLLTVVYSQFNKSLTVTCHWLYKLKALCMEKKNKDKHMYSNLPRSIFNCAINQTPDVTNRFHIIVIQVLSFRCKGKVMYYCPSSTLK